MMFECLGSLELCRINYRTSKMKFLYGREIFNVAGVYAPEKALIFGGVGCCNLKYLNIRKFFYW